jgi:hypothetical protein
MKRNGLSDDEERQSWLVFYGTRVALVPGDTEAEVYERFLAILSPLQRTCAGCNRDHEHIDPVGTAGRLMPPTIDEVRIRRPRESDLGWAADAVKAADRRDAEFLRRLERALELEAA